MTEKSPPPADPLLASIIEGLEILELGEVRRVLEQSLGAPASAETRLAWLWSLLEPQVRRRIEGRIERRFRQSHLPERKTLAAYDFAFQPALDRDLVMELNTLRFVDQGRNILLAGMSGTGKSHIAKALGLSACTANRRVLYSTSADMLARLNASLADDTLVVALKPYIRAELLIIDEIGLEQVERKEASRSGLVQKVLLPRYNDNRSTVITSNIPWEAWADYLDDQLGATALLDRLIHRSHVIVINGPSWRDHEHRQEAQKAKRVGAPGAAAVAPTSAATTSASPTAARATVAVPPTPKRTASTRRPTKPRRRSIPTSHPRPGRAAKTRHT
jgi:DNA replication protein DnaC